MQFLKKNPLFVAFFILILGPTVILSVFSFRNIFNESLIAQKTFEEHQAAFRKDVHEAVIKEQNKIFQETKAASLFLYEQPNNLLDFEKSSPFKMVNGVRTIFLFNADTLLYPHLPSLFENTNASFSPLPAFFSERKIYGQKKSEDILMMRSFRLMQAPLESPAEQALNLIGLIRESYRIKNYDEALRLLEILESRPTEYGYLLPNISASIRLLHFEILVAQKQHRLAEKYILAIVKDFLSGENFGDIAEMQFFFESTFDQILSFEDLSRESREEFWNLRENFNRELLHTDLFLKNKDCILRLWDDEESTLEDGIQIVQNNNLTFFKMSFPWLAGNQVIIGILDKKAHEKRLVQCIRSTAREWKDVPYSIRTSEDSLIIENHAEHEPIALQQEIGNGLHWQLILYEKDLKKIKQESRHKIILMGSLIIFSLFTVVCGMIFLFRFVHQERRLLSMKANFLSSISHELKTPLTSIKMFAEMLSRGRVRSLEKVSDYADRIGKETGRLENLIGAILNYTRMEKGRAAFKWERLNLSTVAEQVYESLEPIALERKLEMDKTFDKELFVTGDFSAIYSLMQGLIENAVKYTNPPGKIHIRIYSETDKAAFEVEDTGIGIPLSEQKNIFNDFYRIGDEMTRSTKGSGLGLAIVKRAADAHKAVIKLNSKPNKGSTFTVLFKKAE